MPENESPAPSNLLGWKRRIAAYLGSHGIEKSESAIRRMAARIDARMTAMNDVHTFEAGLRILGIITDTTARDAIRNIEREKVTA